MNETILFTISGKIPPDSMDLYMTMKPWYISSSSACIKRNNIGIIHCDDGPAYSDNGYHEWIVNGKLHRENGPAVIDKNGSWQWWHHGVLHRENAPAVYIIDYLDEGWFQHGKSHRLDGPAVIYTDGRKRWCVNNIDITDDLFLTMQELNMPPFEQWTDVERTWFRLWA